MIHNSGFGAALNAEHPILERRFPEMEISERPAQFKTRPDRSDVWSRERELSQLSEGFAEMLDSLATWQYFVTLTFRQDVEKNRARKLLVRLIRDLNRNAFGKHYTRKVGHSYFSYVACIEYQTRGNLHFHILVDSPINESLVEAFWHQWAGSSHIQSIRNREAATRYVCKQAYRNGEVDPPYIARKRFTPSPQPSWWKLPME